jgi:ParB-like chromosome segregation protein Spo0J
MEPDKVIKKSAAKGKKAVEVKANKLETLKIEYVPIDSIHPNPFNANRVDPHHFEMLKSSMVQDGFTSPPLVQEETREIVDGEHRWRSAKELGYTEIPVVFVNFTAEQHRISCLRMNRARGQEDIELTAALFRDLRELGALDQAQDALLMDDLELQRLMDDIPISEALAAAEFSTAWQPIQGNESAAGEEGASAIGGTMLRASSVNAVEAIRTAEAKIKEARTEEERAMVKKETDVWRINLVFSGPEAGQVRRVLGEQPAQKLLELCRDYEVRNPVEGAAETPSE